MDDISRKMGISKKTLYKYVDNKADLIQKVIHNHVESENLIMEEIKSEATNALDEISKIAKYIIGQLRQLSPTTLYDLQKYYKDAWLLIESLHRSRVYGIIKENIQRGIEEELYRNDINPDIIAKLYANMTVFLTDEKLFPSKDYQRDVLFKEFISYHIRGIASSKGLKQIKKLLNP